MWTRTTAGSRESSSQGRWERYRSQPLPSAARLYGGHLESRAISLRVTDKVEYCIVDSTNKKAVAYVTDGFGNVKQIPCPYPVTTPVVP